jgi:peptidoglycan/xylan/chitin deacetylase (PgdA/CDA1 family)
MNSSGPEPDVIVGICCHGVGTPSPSLDREAQEYFVSEDLFHAVLDEVAQRPWVQLTFDDGYASDVDVALPALLERGLLAEAGMTVGSHGMRHRSWRGLDAESAHQEFTVARSLIGTAAQAPVRAAACPFGSYDRKVLSALRRHGYTQVFTSDRRRARAGAWLQPRYSIKAGDTLSSVRTGILAPRPVAERLRGAAAAQVKAWR